MKFNPTPLRISTMTITSNFNTEINLPIVSKKLPLVEFYSDDVGCIKIELGGMPIRGYCKKDAENKTKKKKTFYNQATIIIRVLDENSGNCKETNCKLFSNGRIQMTGIKSLESTENTLKLLLESIKDLSDIDDNGEIIPAVRDKVNLKCGKINIHLINSDYTTGFKIKRDVLHDLLVNTYDIYSTYEPCIYPGVNTKYYWNVNNICDGVCNCDEGCDGKGNGQGNGQCKKVTISIFQSGAIIITGATSIEQLNSAYNFINRVLDENFEDLERTPPPEPIEQQTLKIIKKKKKVWLKKDSIKTNNSILYHMDNNEHISK
jgi:TATA-box binding protein (TBP) (component of TFIID and TFIIIB)